MPICILKLYGMGDDMHHLYSLYFFNFLGSVAFTTAFISIVVWEIKQYIESKKIVDLLGSIFLMAFAVALVFYSVPYFRDIPNVINKNYVTITGTVVVADSGVSDDGSRTLTLLTDDGEEVKATVKYTPFTLGERYEITMLPNTRIGYVVRKIE